MSLDAIELPARPTPVGTRNRHGLGKIDRRTKQWRRTDAIIAGLRRQLGGKVLPSQESLVTSAAALTIAIEDMTVAGRLDDPELGRLTNSLRHTLATLGLARAVAGDGAPDPATAELIAIMREAAGKPKPAEGDGGAS